MKRAILLFLAATVPLVASAQEKKPLDHDAYTRWRSIEDQNLSHNGRWAAWREAPDTIGDSDVIVRRTDGSSRYVIARGDDPRFTPDSRWLVAIVKPPYDSTRAAKIKGKKDDHLPKDSLAVLDLMSGTLSVMGPVKSFAVAEDAGDILAVLFDEVESDSTAADSTDAEEAEDSDSTGIDHEKKDGTKLLVRHLARDAEWSFEAAVEYTVSDDGTWVVYTAESEEGEADGAFAVNTITGSVTTMKTGEGYYRQLAIDDDNRRVAFVANADSFASKQPAFFLYRAVLGQAAEPVAMEGSPGIPEGWWVSEHMRPDFSDSGDRLYFGTAPRPEPEEEDDRPDEEKVVLDVWSWKDPFLQPMQLEQLDDELERSFTAVVDRRGRIVQLGTLEIPEIYTLESGDAPVVVGLSSLPYRKEVSWDSPAYNDCYVIDVETGESRLLLEGVQVSFNPRFPQYSTLIPSPYGSHIAWWDRHSLSWKTTATTTGRTTDITSQVDVRFDNVLHDWPYLPDPSGFGGWSSDGRAFLVYDDLDVWVASPDGSLLSNMTDGAGRRDNVRYRYVELDPDAEGIDLSKTLLLSAFDETTKSSGFARLDMGDQGPTRLIMDEQSFGTPAKAKQADRLLFTRQSFTEFGDLWASDLNLDSLARMSDANPQQSGYLWGTAELVHWTSVDGIPLDGILIKPEGFDPSQRYPMMVYFYERNSNTLNYYRGLRPGGSSINPAFYASRGYVVFIPDIPYKVGYPGESAMNAVIPGVTHLIDLGIVDPGRIGVQGHSWGGYQIAYMVTQTNLFAAAEAGAPVTNMTSAYGGIRWGSGMSRMFQYEKTQSRIGGTLWDAQDRYIHNSPLFQAPKVETPLLYMHNDQDGAVPWYQGIEFFVALRRLGKPVWMLNYNGAGHGLRNYWRRVDLQIRMQQFFDHFVKGDPPAEWIVHGIPAVKKGKTMGLELVKEN